MTPLIKPNPETFHNTVPAELLAQPNWILWKAETIPGKPKPNKTPYQRSGVLAATNNPAHWFKFTDEIGVVDASLRLGYSGLGFVLSDALPYTGIDLDHSVNADGSIKPWAQSIVDRLDSYTERTPNDGLRVWIKAKLGDLEGNKHHYQGGVVEFYDRGRYFTVTGAHLPGTPSTIEPRQSELDEVHGAVQAGKAVGLYASNVSEKISRAMSGDLSDYRGDRSAAAAAVLVALATAHRFDKDAVRTGFEATQLRRDWSYKWDERGEKFRQKELDGAIKKAQEDQTAEKVVVDPENWRPLFHSYDEFCNAPPVNFAIEGFLQEDGITMISGLPGHGKTWVMLSMAKALLTGKPLFGYAPFAVRPTERIVYLSPEVGLGPLTSRIKKFHLNEFVKSGKLLYQTLSIPESASLVDPRMLRACRDADVFLDTAVRFMEGDENSSAEQKLFSRILFALLKAGARTVTGAHHAPKAFETANHMSLENAMRGSSELGAMLSTAWGVKRVDKDSNRVFIENIKPRDFNPCQPFVLEGRPHIDSAGDWKMVSEPGRAGELRDNQKNVGRPSKIKGREAAIRSGIQQGKTNAAIADELGVGEETVRRFRKEAEAEGSIQ